MDVYNRFKRDLFIFFAACFALQFAWNILPVGRDATDGEKRSGMALRIDNETGCQYLEGGRGGMTPRLDQSGKHICKQ